MERALVRFESAYVEGFSGPEHASELRNTVDDT